MRLPGGRLALTVGAWLFLGGLLGFAATRPDPVPTVAAGAAQTTTNGSATESAGVGTAGAPIADDPDPVETDPEAGGSGTTLAVDVESDSDSNPDSDADADSAVTVKDAAPSTTTTVAGGETETTAAEGAATSDRLAAGVGQVSFLPTTGPNPGHPITIHYYRPPDVTAGADTPILIVIPGQTRAATDYRETWTAHAAHNQAILIVPEFPLDTYTSDDYNLANLVDSNTGAPTPAEDRTFAVIEELFEWTKAATGSTVDGYLLYGHSAGGQFVQRFMLYTTDHHVLAAVAANAGWYTVPDPAVAFPYGLGQGPGLDLAAAFVNPLTILVGSDDDDPNADGLRRTDEADAQGTNRYDRAGHFHDRAEEVASQAGTKLAWDLVVVEGAGHSNYQMAPAASAILFTN